MKNKQHVVIVGGGFAGLELARGMRPLVKKGLYEVTLISNHGYFEYYPGIYRIMIGESPIQTKIRLTNFLPKHINLVEDSIVRIDPENKKVFGLNNSYSFDKLVLALGSVPNYFGIEGLEDNTFSFRSTGDAVVLRNHLHELLLGAKNTKKEDQQTMLDDMHIIIGGGGPIGVELAGALSSYMRKMARINGVEPSMITIDIVDSSPRLLPRVPEKGSAKIARFLGKRGVNLFLNRPVKRVGHETVFVEDATFKARTIVWAGGVMPHPLYQTLPKCECVRGRVCVNEFLETTGCGDIYIIGDGANTKGAGLAQTAIHDGKYMAKVFKAMAFGKKVPKYTEAKTGYVIPIGSNWALMVFGKFVWAGLIPGFVRYFIDMDYFLKRLPIAKFLDLYGEGFKYRRKKYIVL